MDGQASISTEILARYAGDAAREILGVRGLHGRHAVKVDDDLRVEVHVAVDWGVSIPGVGKNVQARVREYLLRMADLEPASVDVVVDEVGVR
ncbi:MAG: Asp23/Gls24 family envelope stress response protein [Acidobacteriota bacterium]|nr:Asp23/Gls24 family envelope stress response protein [Acidobacteriota bacterium]